MGRVDIVVAFLALLVCLVSADQISDLQAKGFKIDSESPYHVTLTATVLNSETNTIQTETVVVNKEVSSKELLANKVLQRKLSGGKSAEENNLLDVIPVFMGTASQGSVATFSAPCFQQYTATAKITPSGAMIQLVANKASSWTCSDWFLLATRYSLAVKSAFLHGTHNVHMTFKNSEEYEDALNNGIRIFNFKNGALGTIMDAWNGIHLFIGADLTADNVKFLEATMDMKFTERANKPYFPAESEVESGDYLAVTRLDGLDPMIMYGTGSYVGHTAMVLEIDGVLYVCESTDKNPFGKGYWPPPYGIIRTPYQQWLKQAQAANYIVILAKLHPTYRAKFDSVAAANAFKKLEGLPYGYHNFVYGWIDTPNNNLPYPLTPQTLDIALSFVDKLIPTQITRIFVDGLNKRFDTYYNVTTNCTSMDCAFSTLQSLNTTLFEAMSLVELDEWTYSDGKSMVCDVFVLSMYKASGMLGDLANNIQATEFTPKDLYQMKIFDDQYVAPAACQVPGYPYCQILGDFTWALPGFNSIEPYAHMNEKCGAMPPTYVRTPANC